MKAQHSQERQAGEDPAGFGIRAQFLGRRMTSWSSLDVVLDVGVLDWLEDGRWCCCHWYV